MRTGRSTATTEHIPPSLYPASSPVISPPATADLPNRQGLSLQNSSGMRRCLAGNARKARPPGSGVTAALTRPADAASSRPGRRALAQLRGHQLGDLCGIERRALAQVVPTHEEVDRMGIIERLADAPDPGRVCADHVDR